MTFAVCVFAVTLIATVLLWLAEVAAIDADNQDRR